MDNPCFKSYFFIQIIIFSKGEIMENIKKYIISLGYTLGIILIFTIILTILNYFDLLGVKVINILKLIIPIIATIVGAYHVGNNSDRKGYQTGIKYGILLSIISFIFILIFSSINLLSFVYIIILILSSMIGSILGINRKLAKEN